MKVALNKKIIFLLLGSFLSFLAVQAFAEGILEEIEKNIKKTREQIKVGETYLEDLEGNNSKIDKNIKNLINAASEKEDEKKTTHEAIKKYQDRIKEADMARKDFERSIEEDKKELRLIDDDISNTQKKLKNLQMAKEAIEKSMEVSEENIGKIGERVSTWQKGKDTIDSELETINDDAVKLQQKLQEQKKLKTENIQSVAKWNKSITYQKDSLKKLEIRLREAQRQNNK